MVTIAVSSTCTSHGNCTLALNSAMTACVLHAATAPCAVQLDARATYVLDGADGSGALVKVGTGAHAHDRVKKTAHAITLDGRGSEVRIAPLAGFLNVGGLQHGFTLRNVSVDAVRQPYTLGVVTSSDASSTTLLVSDARARYPPPGKGADGKARAYLNTVQSMLQYDPARQRPAVDGYDGYFLPPAQKELQWGAPLANGSAVVTLRGVGAPRALWGATMILRHRVYALNGVSATGVRGLAIEDVTLWSMPGMGFIGTLCAGVTLSRVAIAKRAWGDGSGDVRPMSITADGSHWTSCRGGDVKLLDCLFEGQGDDGLNVPSRYWAMRELAPDRRSARVWQQGVARPFSGLAGDRLNFYNRSTFKAYGHGKAITLVAQTEAHGPAFWINFSVPLPASATAMDLVLDVDNQPASITLSNCTFRNNRARGALLKASNVMVENCRFEGTSGPAIQVIPDAGVHWFEGDTIWRGNWNMRNSVVTDCNYGAARQAADVMVSSQVPVWKDGKPSSTQGKAPAFGIQHRNVTVTNVSFALQHGQAAVGGVGINGFEVSSCRVQRSNATGPYDFLVSSSCENVTLVGNECSDATKCKVGSAADTVLSAARRPISWWWAGRKVTQPRAQARGGAKWTGDMHPALSLGNNPACNHETLQNCAPTYKQLSDAGELWPCPDGKPTTKTCGAPGTCGAHGQCVPGTGSNPLCSGKLTPDRPCCCPMDGCYTEPLYNTVIGVCKGKGCGCGDAQAPSCAPQGAPDACGGAHHGHTCDGPVVPCCFGANVEELQKFFDIGTQAVLNYWAAYNFNNATRKWEIQAESSFNTDGSRPPYNLTAAYGGIADHSQAWLAPQPGGAAFWSDGYYPAGVKGVGGAGGGAMFVLSTEQFWGGTWYMLNQLTLDRGPAGGYPVELGCKVSNNNCWAAGNAGEMDFLETGWNLGNISGDPMFQRSFSTQFNQIGRCFNGGINGGGFHSENFVVTSPPPLKGAKPQPVVYVAVVDSVGNWLYRLPADEAEALWPGIGRKTVAAELPAAPVRAVDEVNPCTGGFCLVFTSNCQARSVADARAQQCGFNGDQGFCGNVFAQMADTGQPLFPAEDCAKDVRGGVDMPWCKAMVDSQQQQQQQQQQETMVPAPGRAPPWLAERLS